MKLKHFIIGIILLVLDQISKFLMINRIISIIPNFLSLTYTTNNGAAFGISNTETALPISIVIIVVIVIFLFLQKDQSTNPMPYILILSGSLGNLIDRIFRGYVIDFIDINLFNFPNFNIADICIVFGFIYLIYIIVFKMNAQKYKKSLS